MGGEGSTALSAQALFDISARAQTFFDIAAQRSDPLLPLSAPPFCHQRSALIPNFGSPLSAQDLHQLPALSAQGNFSKSLSAQGPPWPPPNNENLKKHRALSKSEMFIFH